MRMLEHNEMMSILPVTPKPGKGGFFSQPPACHAETRGDEDQRRRVTPTCRVEAFLTRRSFSEGGSEDGSQAKADQLFAINRLWSCSRRLSTE